MTLAPLRGVELKRFRSGEAEHFLTVVRQYGAAVKAVANSFARDEDELQDLCQDIWLRVYARRGEYRGTGPLLAWILTLGRRWCVSRVRSRSAEERALGRLHAGWVDRWPERPEPSRDPAQAAEDELRLAAALRRLTSRQRLAVLLRLYYGFSVEETASAMGCAQATVRSLMRNGLIKLRGVYGEP